MGFGSIMLTYTVCAPGNNRSVLHNSSNDSAFSPILSYEETFNAGAPRQRQEDRSLSVYHCRMRGSRL